MRTLIKIASSLTGVLIMIIGGMVPAAILVPHKHHLVNVINLPISWQIPSLLVIGLVCGPRIGVITALAYLTVGLFFLPIFHGGGSIGYLAIPDFGYLAGFVPAVWITGRIARIKNKNTVLQFFKACLSGLTTIHSIGIINLIIGSVFISWPENLFELIIKYTISTFPIQIILCPSIVVMAILARKLLLIR